MKIVTVVGARPQFIKAAVVSRVLRKEHMEILVHTGQHYDYEMSGIFFDDLDLPKPDYYLGISGGTHGKMTGAMLNEIEKVLLKESPDLLLVYGDTNSTLAGSLAAVKLHIPVCHVESGGRLGTLTNPEEINRICTDHVSSLLMCCTNSAIDFLKKEGLTNNVYLVGDPMYDAFIYFGKRISDKEIINIVGLDGGKVLVPNDYYYLTCHREENTSTNETLIEVLSAMDSLDAPTIYPVHPRNREHVKELCNQHDFKNIILTQPVGYLTSIALVKGAKKIVTDSGGLQREAFFAGVQCVTVFDYVVWPETMVGKQNQLAKPDKQDILSKLSVEIQRDSDYQPFGDGHAAEKIVEAMTSLYKLKQDGVSPEHISELQVLKRYTSKIKHKEQLSLAKKICVIGGGRWGHNHIRTLYQMGNLAGIVEANQQRLDDLIAQYPVLGFTEIDDANQQGFDGYILATPAETHYPLGKRLLKQGLNVLIEKPMTLSSEHSKELIEIAGQTGAKLMVGHLLLFHPAIKKIKKLVESGKIGQLYYMYSTRLNLGTVRTEENVFWSFAPHDISILDYLIGSPAIKIEAKGVKYLQDNIYDMTMAQFSYPGNVHAHIFVSWLHPFKEQRLVLVGSNGMISFDDSSPEKNILYYNKRIDWLDGKPVKVEQPDEIIAYDKGMPLAEELKYFIENMDKTIEIASGRTGHEVVKVLEIVQRLISKEL